MERVVIPIDRDRDPSQDALPLAREEEGAFPMLEERVLPRREAHALIGPKGRDPVGMVAVEPVRELDEAAKLFGGMDRLDRHRGAAGRRESAAG
jgi:hypothetical protein